MIQFPIGSTVSNLTGNRYGVVDNYAAEGGKFLIVVAWFDGNTRKVSPTNLKLISN